MCESMKEDLLMGNPKNNRTETYSVGLGNHIYRFGITTLASFQQCPPSLN